MPKRSIFEVFKDTLVGILRALREFIESIWYGKDYDKVQQERIMDEIKNSKTIKEANDEYSKNLKELEEHRTKEYAKTSSKLAKDVIPMDDKKIEIPNKPKPKEDTIEITTKDLDTHIKAISKNSYQIIQDNIDNVLSKTPSAYKCETDGAVYDINIENVNKNNSLISVSYEGKDVLSYNVEKIANEQGDIELRQTNIKQKIKDFSEIGIENTNSKEKIDIKEFEASLLKKAIETIEQDKRFFEYNGHIFDTRINKANQYIICNSTTNEFVMKKGINKTDMQGVHKKDDVIKKMCIKGSLVLPALTTLNELKEVLKKNEIDIKQLKDGRFMLSKKGESIFADNKNVNNTQTFEPIIKDTVLLAQTVNFIKAQFEKTSQTFSDKTLQNAIETNDLEKAMREIEKIKVSSEIINAKQIHVPENIHMLLDEKREQMKETIISFMKDEMPENIEDIKKMLLMYDDIDSLSSLNYEISQNKDIPEEQKKLFKDACESKISDLTVAKTAYVIDETTPSKKLQEYKMHLDKEFAKNADERLADIINGAAKLANDCISKNKQEKFSEEFAEVTKNINDKETLSELKDKIEGENYINDEMQEIIDNKFNEKLEEIENPTVDNPEEVR